MKQKKVLVIGSVVLIFIIIALTWFFGWGTGTKKDKSQSIKKPTPTVVPVELSEDQMPETALTINSDRSGGEVTVAKIDKQFTNLEYEIIYLAHNEDQEIERGISGGPIEVTQNRTVSDSFIFGTQSCTTGVCKSRIDKDVSGGSLIVRLITNDNRIWNLEKKFLINKIKNGFEVSWVE